MASTPMPKNYPSNSKSEPAEEKKEEKKVEPVVTGKVRQRKKPLGRRISEMLTGDDAQSVGEYILLDVFIPATKAMLADAASQGAERLLFGEVRRPRSTGTTYRPGYTSYNKPAGAPADRRGFPASAPRSREISRRGRSNHTFEEVIIETRGEAEEVLDNLQAMMDQYDVVTVMDFYDLVGITGNFTDEKFGWFDLRQAEVRRVREGFIINLPRPVDIDN